MATRGSAPRVLKVLVVGDNSVNKGLLLAKFEDSQQQNFPFVSTIGEWLLAPAKLVSAN